MKEIKYGIERAQQWRRFLTRDGIANHFEWCITTGLWETAGWISSEGDDGPKMFQWFVPGEKAFII